MIVVQIARKDDMKRNMLTPSTAIAVSTSEQHQPARPKVSVCDVGMLLCPTVAV